VRRAIAITDFEALCGFKPLVEIQNNVREIAELNQLIGNECTSALLEADETNYSEALKNAFTALMSSPADTLAASLSSLEGKVRSKGLKSELDELFMRLCGQYPGDVGCFVIFLVNHVK
jgi:mannose-6-phosphate isomerase